MEEVTKTIYYAGINKEKITREPVKTSCRAAREERGAFFRHQESPSQVKTSCRAAREDREERGELFLHQGIFRRIKGKRLPVYKLNRTLPFPGGRLRIYFSLFGEEDVKIRKRRPERSLKKLYRLLEEGISCVNREGFCEEVLVSEELRKILNMEKKEIPLPLWAVCLKEKAPFHRVSLLLPREGGGISTEKALELLKPYLSKINFISMLNEENEETRYLEDYFYEEYGLLAVYGKPPEKNTVWLDLSEEEEAFSENYLREKNVRSVNRAETLKFLDTTVKNGYNTKVN